MFKNYYKITKAADAEWVSEQELVELCEPGRRGFIRKWVEDGVLIDIYLK